MRSKYLISLLAIFICLALVGTFVVLHKEARAEPDIFASSINAGCYIAGPNDCRFHVEPFTINLSNASSTLVLFRIVANRSGGGSQVIYDFRPDSKIPPPPSGSTYTPSLVALDFAASCGFSYTLTLIGQDTGDILRTLGTTAQFTCPSVVP